MMPICTATRWPTPTATPTTHDIGAWCGASLIIAGGVAILTPEPVSVFVGIAIAAATVGAWLFWPAIRAARQAAEAFDTECDRLSKACATPPDASKTCDHTWDEEYYGYRCPKCDAFIAYGNEPWLPDDADYVAMGDRLIATMEEVKHDGR